MLNVVLFFILGLFPPTSLACQYDDPNHSVCRYGYLPDKPSPLTAGEKRRILNMHNEKRRTANIHGRVPSNMMKMVWDNELESIAKAWAKKCVSGHDDVRTHSKYKVNAGQNYAATSGKDSIAFAINGWWDEEVKYFSWGIDNLGTGAGHLLQMAMWNAVKLGCARSKCPDGMSKIYCNYLNSNYGELRKNPYISGGRASLCPKFKKNGLCDCGGKYCANGGIMILEKCECKCRRGFFGKECTEKEAGLEFPKLLGSDDDGKPCKGSCTVSWANCKNYGGSQLTQAECESNDDASFCINMACKDQCDGKRYILACPYFCGHCKESNNKGKCENNKMYASECDIWAKRQECEKNPVWMSKNCKRSCKQCKDNTDEDRTKTDDSNTGTCSNKRDNYQCEKFAERGDCNNYPDWMKYNCASTCRMC